MKFRVLLSLCFFAATYCAFAQEPAPSSGAPATVIRTETREVLVDTVVTDKRGTYIRDLTVKDFRIWEDDKEQQVKSFSYGADPASPTSTQRHYLVLFFDNSTMDMGDQARARIAAAHFIDANAGPNQYIAIANFGGVLEIAQNFTQDAGRLKKVVSAVKFSAVSPSEDAQVASLGLPPVLSGPADFGVRTVILALRTLAKNLAPLPGRKSVVLLSSGFDATPELELEVTAAIDACNRANVAVYPIDVRGLSTGMSIARRETVRPETGKFGRIASADLRWTGSPMPSHGGANLVYVQKGGGGGGGGGHATGPTGPTGPTNGGGLIMAGDPTYGGLVGGRSIDQLRPIAPPLMTSVSANQQVLEQLASGTGGFVIINSNDLLGSMQKVSKEQSEYYVLGYEPAKTDDGSCHTLKVKVDRNGTLVRSRSGYCNVRPQNLLAGKPIEKELEGRANGTQAGVSASMAMPFFYTSANTARVDLAIDMPADAIKFDKDKAGYKAAVNVLGMAYKPDGTVAAKFSDTANIDFTDKKQVDQFAKLPYHYEDQFDIAAGTYTLKVAFTSGGENFGKLEKPLVIEPYDKKEFSISGLAISRQLVPVRDINAGLESELVEDKKPLIFEGVQFLPTGDNHFKRTERVGAYLELYDPFLLQENPPKVSLQIFIVDQKTSKEAIRAAISDTSHDIKPGNPVIPLGLLLPIQRLDPGSYVLSLRAVDSAGNSTKLRSTEFQLE